MNLVVIGAGAWGTAMARHLVTRGHHVSLVARGLEQAMELASTRENATYLPGISLPEDLQIGHEVLPVLMEADVVLLATPAKGIAEAVDAIVRARASAWQLEAIITLAKGLRPEGFGRTSEIVTEKLPDVPVGCLSGPTRALEVARGQPTAMTLAGKGAWVEPVQAALSGPTLRIYRSEDLPGVEWAGCLKNVYAIGAGISDGLGLGDNARAAYLTRALAEMVRLGTHLGGRLDTFYGLSGFGDLVATCQGAWSRNHQLGDAVATGHDPAEWIASRGQSVEGFASTAAFHHAFAGTKVEAPILTAIHGVLYEGHDPARSIGALMSRELKAEAARA